MSHFNLYFDIAVFQTTLGKAKQVWFKEKDTRLQTPVLAALKTVSPWMNSSQTLNNTLIHQPANTLHVHNSVWFYRQVSTKQSKQESDTQTVSAWPGISHTVLGYDLWTSLQRPASRSVSLIAVFSQSASWMTLLPTP